MFTLLDMARRELLTVADGAKPETEFPKRVKTDVTGHKKTAATVKPGQGGRHRKEAILDHK